VAPMMMMMMMMIMIIIQQIKLADYPNNTDMKSVICDGFCIH
jgi:hypothetical protein